jgi:hypothetical protein
MCDEVEIQTRADEINHEIVGWQKNLFLVPQGKAGADFICKIVSGHPAASLHFAPEVSEVEAYEAQ